MNQSSEPYRIRCAEIWGGAARADSDVCTRGLSASIFSVACGSDRGGDVYYFSVCSADLLTRIAIADMRGHGASASPLSEWLFEALQRRMNSLDGAGVLTELNDAVRIHGFEAITTAAVLGYYVSKRRLYFTYAGHPPVLVRREADAWTALPVADRGDRTNLPLGVLPGVAYRQEEVDLQPGDRLFLYTDGVIECPDAAGEEFGEERLLPLLASCGALPLSEARQAVAAALRRHAGGDFQHDDCTFMVLEVNIEA